MITVLMNVIIHIYIASDQYYDLIQYLQVETFDSMTALFMSSWDERVGSGDWGQIPLGVIVTTIKAGSSESVIILSGLDIVISPSMDLGPTEDLVPHATPHTPSAPKGCLMPSEINLRVGLMTLVRKPSMDISIMSPLLRVDHGLGPEDEIGQEDGSDEIEDQDEENENACRETSSHGSGVQFPHHAHDLSQALRAVIEFDTQKGDMSTPEKATPCPPGGGAGTVDTSSVPCGVASAPLLKVRFEASMAEVSLSISADLPQRRSHNISRPLYTTSSSGSGSGLFRSTSNRRVDDAPPSRQLVKPFSLHYVSSLDLHPFLPSPSLTGPSSAYNREYSLSPNSFTISSSYLSVDGLAINSSLLDLIRALNVIETTAHMVRVSRGYGLVFRPPQPLKQASAGGLNSSAADGSPLPPASLQQQIEDESEEAVKHASLSMFKCSNVDIAIVPASDGSAPAVLALVTEFVHIVLERPHTTAASPGNAEGELPLRLMQSGSQTSSSGHSVGDGERETVGAFEKEREVKSAREGEGDREEESEREGDKESISSSPDDWSDWICDDRHSALHAIAASSAAASALPTVARALTYDAAPQRQHRTVVKLVCGNLMLSTKGSPLLCLHASSTVRDALSLVTQRCFVGAQRRPQAAVGDSAPFLLIRCELSCTPRQSRRVESIGESKLHPFERAVPGDPPIGPNGHQASSAVYPQHSRDPLSSMSLQVEVPCCSVKESPTKHASGSRSAGKGTGDGKGTGKGDGKGTGKGDGKGVGNQGAEDGKRIGQVVLVPKAFEGCLQGLLRELLEGFGWVALSMLLLSHPHW